MTVLVTGGAGYTGANMLLALEDRQEKAVTLDNLSTGAAWMVPSSAPMIEGDLGDGAILDDIFNAHDITEVIHFAGSINIDQSFNDPLGYYHNNTANSLRLLEACVKYGVERFIFSSTASVYGRPQRIPISESAPILPLSPYGASMAMIERMLQDTAMAHGLKYAILRYFNVAGADPKMRAGEIGRPRHLIKVAAQIAVGTRRENLQVYGEDYPTPDGTAIRDYVHITDLVEAHLLAMEHLRKSGDSLTLNCGYGRGYSVHEVIEAVSRVSGAPLPFEVAPRRRGDAPQLIADSAAIRASLDWRPRYDDIDYIVRSAIKWEEVLAQKGHNKAS